MKYKLYQMVRVKGVSKGDPDEFAHVRAVYDDGTYWISNLNMPFSGTISAVVSANEIERLVSDG